MSSKKEAKSLINYLKKRNIEARFFWFNLSSQKPYQKYVCFSNGIARKLSEKIISLPSSTNLSEKEQKSVIKSILNWVQKT